MAFRNINNSLLRTTEGKYDMLMLMSYENLEFYERMETRKHRKNKNDR